MIIFLAVLAGYSAVGLLSGHVVSKWAEREGRRNHPILYRTEENREWCRQNDRAVVLWAGVAWPVAVPTYLFLMEPWKR